MRKKTILQIVLWLFSVTPVFAQEELLYKIYSEELDVIRESRISYLYSAYGINDPSIPEASRLKEAVDYDLDQFGASLDEYLSARSIVSINPSYHKFLFSHRLPDKDELDLFNKYVGAVLTTMPTPYVGDIPLVILPHLPSPKRAKIKAESVDPVTGGKMWTFDNGIRVIYKNMGQKGRFDFGMVIKGGASVFVGDLLEYYDIGKLHWYEFKRYLDLKGIITEVNTNPADLRICGSAPTSSLVSLIQGLSLLVKEGNLNKDGFDLYRRRELKKLEKSDLDATIDSLMRRDYDYSQYRFVSHLSGDMDDVAREYYSHQFKRFNDGVIVILGDLEEKTLRSTLEKYLGGLPTNKNYYVRPSIQYELRNGSSVHMEYSDDLEPGVTVAMSVISPVSAETFIALDFLKAMMEKELRAEVKTNVELFPQERMTLTVKFGETDNPSAAIGKCREAIASLMETALSEEEFSLYKSYLIDQYNVRMSDPKWLEEFVFYRYSQGKDFSGKYQDRIRAMKTSSYMSLLNLLSEGARVEYVVLKKN